MAPVFSTPIFQSPFPSCLACPLCFNDRGPNSVLVTTNLHTVRPSLTFNRVSLSIELRVHGSSIYSAVEKSRRHGLFQDARAARLRSLKRWRWNVDSRLERRKRPPRKPHRTRDKSSPRQSRWNAMQRRRWLIREKCNELPLPRWSIPIQLDLSKSNFRYAFPHPPPWIIFPCRGIKNANSSTRIPFWLIIYRFPHKIMLNAQNYSTVHSVNINSFVHSLSIDCLKISSRWELLNFSLLFARHVPSNRGTSTFGCISIVGNSLEGSAISQFLPYYVGITVIVFALGQLWTRR